MATRPDCEGTYGSGTYGHLPYASHVQCGDSEDTRPDCGGIYGSGTYGQRYYAGHIQCVPDQIETRPDCGGIYGTGSYGMRYYAGHIHCGDTPPIPPEPTATRAKGYSNGRIKPRKEEDLDDLLWIIMLWNAIPRPSASIDPLEDR